MNTKTWSIAFDHIPETIIHDMRILYFKVLGTKVLASVIALLAEIPAMHW